MGKTPPVLVGTRLNETGGPSGAGTRSICMTPPFAAIGIDSEYTGLRGPMRATPSPTNAEAISAIRMTMRTFIRARCVDFTCT
jgi:hypothetical protein